MSKKIYFLKTHKVNITNIVVAQLIKNAGARCYGPCLYELDGKFIKTTLGDFALSQFTFTNQSVRDLDWASHISVLEQFVDQAYNVDKFLIFGNHKHNQISELKQQFNSDILTIDISYPENLYPMLIKNMAEYHVHLLKNNILTPTADDVILLSSKNDKELIDLFCVEFMKLDLIPHSSNVPADYVIPVVDLMDKSSMSTHFTAIGLPFTTESESFYDQWLNLQYN